METSCRHVVPGLPSSPESFQDDRAEVADDPQRLEFVLQPPSDQLGPLCKYFTIIINELSRVCMLEH